MQVTGTIKLISDTQTFGVSGFRKRELVLTTDDQYPQMLLIEFVQDKCDILDNYKLGQEVTISINLRGREWINPEGIAKYFNSITGWRIETTPLSAIDRKATAQNTSVAQNEEPDDLPF
ncbi:DUF3127 domain-containing protein [Wenyingzhuangia sp. 2_MG-2023]|uniref:DUF3127 domain-containing protein n=1 Tax=Wenyingzhuangia sp. 2_MG-2023 TaxID=3062639 RepID=UPI0026E160BF|nr:DUF3127 domain-containing protein [Wenyingzhuangia sp. 2_MG-2023]MDO6737130.1 DUF3127 domain-containing protein [Wenyingzhuangia sp. 2_MG-2023]